MQRANLRQPATATARAFSHTATSGRPCLTRPAGGDVGDRVGWRVAASRDSVVPDASRRRDTASECAPSTAPAGCTRRTADGEPLASIGASSRRGTRRRSGRAAASGDSAHRCAWISLNTSLPWTAPVCDPSKGIAGMHGAIVSAPTADERCGRPRCSRRRFVGNVGALRCAARSRSSPQRTACAGAGSRHAPGVPGRRPAGSGRSAWAPGSACGGFHGTTGSPMARPMCAAWRNSSRRGLAQHARATGARQTRRPTRRCPCLRGVGTPGASPTRSARDHRAATA